jgi:transposase
MLFPLAGGGGAVIKLGELVMILDLHRQGLSVSAIARQLSVVRSAIAKELEPPKYKTRTPRPRITDPFEPYLKERLAALSWPNGGAIVARGQGTWLRGCPR